MKIKEHQHKSNKWWETTWQGDVFSLWDDTEGEKGSRRASFPLPFPVSASFFHFTSHSIILSLLLPYFSFSASFTPQYVFLPPFYCLQNMKGPVSFLPYFPHKKQGKKTQDKSQWCTVWFNKWSLGNLITQHTCLHKVALRDWLMPDAAGCLWTKRTHTCNPFGFGATLCVRWVPTERSLRMTDCTLTLQGVEERYTPFMKSKMENPFTRADSWPERKKRRRSLF